MLQRNTVLENGISHWGTKPLLLAEFSGSIEQTTARYKHLVKELGAIGTEDGRYKKISGEALAAFVLSGEHTFLFPPQEAIILHSKPDDRSHEYADDGTLITTEHKRGAIDGSYIDSEIGVVFDATQEPPVLSVYELYRAHGHTSTERTDDPTSPQYDAIKPAIDSAIESVESYQ